MHSKMVEDMLQMTMIQHGATLECKWEAFNKVMFSCTNKCFSTSINLGNVSINVVQRKNSLIKNDMKVESAFWIHPKIKIMM